MSSPYYFFFTNNQNTVGFQNRDINGVGFVGEQRILKAGSQLEVVDEAPVVVDSALPTAWEKNITKLQCNKPSMTQLHD